MRKKSALAVVVLAIILAAVLMVLKPWATRNPLNLESFPQVSKVETNSSQSRTQTIVHLRDWHFVPYDQFVLDQNQLAGKELSQDELAALWGSFLETVEQVQAEQMAIVRKLGVREVFSEGLWPEGMDNYQIRLSILKEQAEAQPDTDPQARRGGRDHQECNRGQKGKSGQIENGNPRDQRRLGYEVSRC